MAITARVNAYSNFGVLGTDSCYRKLVHQCFRVKFIPKKKKPALYFFFFILCLLCYPEVQEKGCRAPPGGIYPGKDASPPPTCLFFLFLFHLIIIPFLFHGLARLCVTSPVGTGKRNQTPQNPLLLHMNVYIYIWKCRTLVIYFERRR